MVTKEVKPIFEYTANLFWYGQTNTFNTVATSEAKAKQNCCFQLAKLANVSVAVVMANYKKNPDHLSITKIG